MKTTIKDCARCGQTHEDIELKKFSMPIVVGSNRVATHFAMCPTNQEPILATIYISNA